MSSSQDSQTQPFPPLCLNSVQSQADDFNSIQKKISYSGPPKQKPQIIDYYICYIWGFVSSGKRPLLFAFMAMTQHRSTTIFKIIDALCFDNVFPFSFGMIDFSSVCKWRRENNRLTKIDVGISYVLKTGVSTHSI